MQTVVTKLFVPGIVALLFILYNVLHANHVVAVKPNLKTTKDIALPPCASCRVLMQSFKKNFERTKTGKFEGGDSAWEEDNMGSYKKSELRLIEIQEGLCNEVENGQAQCQALAEELESIIEEWWFNHQDSYPDSYEYVCIERSRRCCPKGHYGPNCDECPGYPDKVCSNNGKCKGDGSRKGNGSCLCDKGYAGQVCSECTPDHYEAYRDDNKLLCSPCHAACKGSCKGPGTRDCDACAKGWREKISDASKGCSDINECAELKDTCKTNEFCVNTEGSYHCLGCDRACNGCMGDGPDMCLKCADGYIKKNKICVHADTINKKRTENMARYATYFGLGVATCIIFQRNIYIAGVIGVLVSSYIAVSEYTIYHNSVPDLGSDMNLMNPAT